MRPAGFTTAIFLSTPPCATVRSTLAEFPQRRGCLLGPAYALVRHAFIARRPEALRRRDSRPVENILVSFGATDPRMLTPDALDALDGFADDISITIALSSQAPHLDEVLGKLRGRMQIILDGDMAELMTLADLAVGAAGASSYERAVLGLPSIVVTLADNQAGIAKALFAAGVAVDAGQFDEMLPSRLIHCTAIDRRSGYVHCHGRSRWFPVGRPRPAAFAD